jgi:hypothetical protein
MSFRSVISHGSAASPLLYQGIVSGVHDTLPDNQLLYNGRVWQNLYPGVRDDQFLFTRQFLKGSVTMRGITFKDIWLRYDIFKDELLTPGITGGVLQLNKELVDSFSIFHSSRNYSFIKIAGETMGVTGGYYNILYNGKHAFYARYIKKIGKLAEEGKYDRFYQVTRFYAADDKKLYQVSRRKDMERFYGKNKTAIRDFIRNNNPGISREDPAGFVAILHYLDNLR